MGTAPRERQHPAMPDPHRTVTKSLSLLRQLGMDYEPALRLIMAVCVAAQKRSPQPSEATHGWLSDVYYDALQRVAVLYPSNDEPNGDEHGDGTSGRASRAASGRPTAGRP